MTARCNDVEISGNRGAAGEKWTFGARTAEGQCREIMIIHQCALVKRSDSHDLLEMSLDSSHQKNGNNFAILRIVPHNVNRHNRRKVVPRTRVAGASAAKPKYAPFAL